nr:recombinase family protein [Cryobacterium frigoriphilum]
MLIGYARVSTNNHDRTAQKNALVVFGLSLQKTFIDQGFTGSNQAGHVERRPRFMT